MDRIEQRGGKPEGDWDPQSLLAPSTPEAGEAAPAEGAPAIPIPEATGFSASEEMTYLTPETLIAYCESRLGALDAQIASIFQRQDGMNDQSEALSALATDLRGAANGDAVGNKGRMEAITASYDKAIKAVGADSDVGRALVKQRNEFEAARAAGKVSVESVKEGIKSVESVSSDLGNDAQLNMVRLQSLVSQRQTALTLCTNLVSSLSEASKAIAQNVGR